MARSGAKGGEGPKYPTNYNRDKKGPYLTGGAVKIFCSPKYKRRAPNVHATFWVPYLYGRPWVAAFLVKDCPRFRLRLA